MLAAAVLVPWLVYLRTLHPGLPAGDSGELITVAMTGGVAHPPGYPLATLIGWAWAHALPFGNVAWRFNLLSACTMAAAAGVLAAAVRRASGSAFAGVLAAWLFALSTPVWKYALVAEVFPLLALFAAFALLALARLVPRAPGDASHDPRELDRAAALLGLLCGLAIAHQQTLLLLALPAVVVAFALAWRARGRGRRLRLWLLVKGCGVLGMLPLIWLPFASTHAGAMRWGDATSVRGFLALLTRADYGSLSLAPVESGWPRGHGFGTAFLAGLPAEVGWLAVAAAVLGASSLAQRSRALAIVLVAYALAQTWFFTRIGLPADAAWAQGVLERFHILPELVLAFLAGLGLARAFELVARAPLVGRVVSAAALVAFALWPLPSRARELDQRDNHFAATLAHDILASQPRNTVLFVRGDLFHNALGYAQAVEHLRPDVLVLDQELMTYDWYVRRVRAEHPDALPPLGGAERITLADGRVVPGWLHTHAPGVLDLLDEDDQRVVAPAAIVRVEPAPPESLFLASRATFRRGPLLASGEDRYSGLPGTRNLLWLDHLAGRRPVAFIGAKDASDTLHWSFVPVGFVARAVPRESTLSVAQVAAWELAALDSIDLMPYFGRYEPHAIEVAERWRFAALFERAALFSCRSEAAAALAAHPFARERMLDFAARFEAEPRAEAPGCLKAVAYLRIFAPRFHDLAKARADLERYLASGGEALGDDEARATLAQLDHTSR